MFEQKTRQVRKNIIRYARIGRFRAPRLSLIGRYLTESPKIADVCLLRI
jgi:hypothetical protein